MIDTERLIEVLRPELDSIRRHLVDLRPLVATDDTIGGFFIERLELALECAAGCILLAKADLAYPLAVLARSMLELTMHTFWAASTPERALEASGASVAEAMRIMKSLIAKGHGKIVNKNTGEDKTEWIQDAIGRNKIAPRKQVAEMARECGLGRLYERFYPLQSMPSHGHIIALSEGRGGDKELYSMMAGIRANLKAIHFTVVKRISQNQATTLAELEGFLNVGLVPPADQSSARL